MALSMMMVSCNEDIDNYFSLNNSDVQFSDIADYIKLDEDHPDAEALSFSWTPAHNYGNDYITTYKYQFTVDGSSANEIAEYEDDKNFKRSYTNAELQDILVNHFGQKTSSVCNVLLTITASFEGPTLKVPDVTKKSIKVKTYGPKQFLADKLYASGSAMADGTIELKSQESDNMVYSATVNLVAGTLNFPIDYADEKNALGPLTANEAITNSDMDAIVTDETKANSWVIQEADNYRITINMRNHTVKIVAAGAIVEADQIFLAGTATGSEQIEVEKTLENDNIYAWRGDLKAGKLYIPLTFNDAQDMSLVPQDATEHAIADGETMTFAIAPTAQANQRYWNIPADGTYRIVIDTEEKMMRIYSAATDLKNTTVSYNNTDLGVNPYSKEVTKLWMWGSFNSFAHDTGTAEDVQEKPKNIADGFQEMYTLKQSLANPNIFVYKGAILPRESAAIGGDTPKGAVKFCVSNHNNNVYAYGSTADAKRNDHNGFITVTDSSPLGLVAGQGDNRYAFFLLPENCNFIVVDIEKLTVTFGTK